MKLCKTIALFALLFGLAASVQAQEQQQKENELAVSYGFSLLHAADYALDGLPDEMEDGHEGRYVGAIGIQYLRTVHRRIAVGALFTYENGSVTATLPTYGGAPRRITNHHNYFSLLGVAKFMWFNKKNVGMYSKFGLGPILETANGKPEYKCEGGLAFQVSAIGIEAGTRNVRAFAELGVGIQGIALAGIKVNF